LECEAAGDQKPDQEQQREQDLLMYMTVNMLEAAYFEYSKQDTKFRDAQWSGWKLYIEGWVRHPEFRRRFPDLIEWWDNDFGQHIREVHEEALKSGPPIEGEHLRKKGAAPQGA
jgi:hypothetical protein